MSGTGRRGHGLGDPRLAWNVLLRVRLAAPPDPAAVGHRLAEVRREVRWPVAVMDPGVSTGPDVLAALADATAAGASARVDGATVSLRAAHGDLDGLGLLVLLGRALGVPVRSAARGVGQRAAQGSVASAVLRRLAEIAVAPQARVAPAPGRAGRGEALAARTLDREVDVAGLVVATVAAVRDWNERHGLPARRVSVAVGVATVGGAEAGLADQSAFLRLRAAERLDVAGVRAALRHAPVQHGGGRGGRRSGMLPGLLLRLLLRLLVGVGTRLLADRLGSTVLVSHLGRVEAPGVDALEFYPVSGGGSGLAVGAATVGGRTTVTLRARAARHGEGLDAILEAVTAGIGARPTD